MTPVAGPGPGVVRSTLDGLVPYEPGKPVETVQRELGLERVVKLASNEGPFGPFPEAIEAVERALAESNRYPDGGCYRLREELSARHGVDFGEVIVAAGADAVIGCACQATLDTGDEIVTPWPSFPSYVLDPLKAGAITARIPLEDGRVDVDALLGAVTDRTKLAFLPTVNNPTGTMTSRADVLRFLEAVPGHVLTVVDDAYFHYVDDPDFLDAIEETAKEGRRVLVLRTFSKIYGLAGLRIGYGVELRRGDHGDAQGSARLRRDDPGPGGCPREPRRRGRARPASRGQPRGDGRARDRPSRARLRTGRAGRRQLPLRRRRRDADALNQSLLRRGVIVRPMGSFGAPTALRITAGTPEEIAFLADQLAAVFSNA